MRKRRCKRKGRRRKRKRRERQKEELKRRLGAEVSHYTGIERRKFCLNSAA